MSDKAETVTCRLCGDTGTVHFKGGDEDCAACHARMVLDTGAGVAPLTVSAAPYPDRCIPADPLSGLHSSNATGHDGCIRGLEKANATIAEQAAGLERLKGQLASCADQRQRLTTDRDTLRLEVQRLKDLNFEAQDRYAALEAERDEARRASETVHSHYVLALKQRDEAVADTRAECDKGYEALFQAHQRMVAERDELRIEVARLRDRLLQSLAEGGADQAEAERQVRTLADELDEANARAESYKVALDAQLEHVQALAHLVNVSQRATSAMVAAGYNRRGGR